VARPSQVVVLAEDQVQVRLVRAYLKGRGFSNHDITVEPLSSGRGSGEQWVRERYSKAVKAYRWRSTKAATALVVMIDADTGSVDRRLQQLRQALVQHGLDERSQTERIAHLVPKRSVETWILCLNESQVDEDTDYRAEPGVDKQIGTAATVFFDWSRLNAQIPQNCVPSLLSAMPEIRRLDV
jgi:hypothetical protein